MHVLPQLRELERRFPREVAVVGVHSGKYTAERVSARIAEAALRYGVHHPVLNDRQFRVWRAYAVRAWPTLTVIDPEGYVLGAHAGEFVSEKLEPLVERLIGKFDPPGLLRRGTVPVEMAAPAIQPVLLRYPGKVSLGPPDDPGRGRRVAVSDTGQHRVLVGRLDDGGRRMRVELVVGAGEPGNADGPAREARFDAPQGTAFTGPGSGTLLVADSENHLLRSVDLATGAVTTVAGTGRQLRTRADRAAGALSSPWDVCVSGSATYVAMAGSHQLWRGGTDGRGLAPWAGTGGEDIRDASLGEALLAQPMGVAPAPGGGVWFVDAESSAVREAGAEGVRTIVGTGLFDFGDVDGGGDAVRMQHQQGIAAHRDGRLLVADSYNDALKWVDPRTRQATTWVRGFHEPGGLALGDNLVYVADTNAHRVAVVDERTGEVSELEIAM